MPTNGNSPSDPTGPIHSSDGSWDTAANSTQDRLAAAGHVTQDSEFFNPIPPGYRTGQHKYVVVLGTVMSGLGKGIFSSSVAKLLKDKGLTVAPIKMEGYLNVDSGTLSPYRHGEVFVLDDGLETDMDLGTYERLLDQNLTRANYITSGQIYKRVLTKERDGDYLGRDVQMIPHVTGEVKYLLRELAMKQQADVVFVEVGGTVGDHENAFYIEALRQLAFEEGESSVCFVALTYVIEPPALGEQKSKAAQLGLKKLLEAGVQPHLIAVRSQNPVQETVRQKIALFSNVPMRRVFSMHDRESIYVIPDACRRSGLDRELLTMLDLHEKVEQEVEDAAREKWSSFVSRRTGPRNFKVKVGITGKYASLRDAYASIDKALEHCGAHLSTEIEVDWIDTTTFKPEETGQRLDALDAVIVPGGFGERGTDSKIACVRWCREHNLPYLGICLGFQMAVIDHARHVCNLEGATSTEFNPETPHPVISMLPEQKKIEGLGGNMRLGGKDVRVTPHTLASFLFDPAAEAPFTIRERFRHRYEVEPDYIQRLEAGGLVFSGRHPKQPIMQILELPPETHPYFIGAQFHPELTGRPLRPQPMFMGLVAAAIQHAHPTINPTDISKRWLPAGFHETGVRVH